MSSQFPGDQPADSTPPPPSWTPAPPAPAPAPDPAAASVPAAGWYADPAGTGQLRYWDGAAWTDHLSAVPAAAPLYGSAPAAAYGSYGGYAPQPRSVGFGDAVRLAFRNWKDYESRSTRSEFWWFFLFSYLVGFGVYAVFFVVFALIAAVASSTSSGSTGSTSSAGTAVAAILGILLALAFLAFAVVFFAVSLALTVRRLHDTGRSGWWYLISLVPFVGIVLIVFLALESTPGPNQYGPFPA